MIATGCCSGELIRAGSFLNVASCAANFESQKLSWPSQATNWLFRPTSTAGEPTVSMLPGNATLVFNARGYFFSGAVIIGGALEENGTASAFWATEDGHIVNNATGLCISTSVPAASVGQQLNLQPCSAAKQRYIDGAAATQLFQLAASPPRILTSEQLCATAERPLDASGVARLISATCDLDATSQSQAFNFTDGRLVAFGLPGAPAADAGASTWWGARVPLTTGSGGSPTSAFTWSASPGNPNVGALTHTATGMCLDSGGVPAGHGCLDAAVRGLPYCNPALPFDARLSDLVGRLTVEEATSLLGDAGDTTEPCPTNTAAIPRLDISAYRWLVEVSSMSGSKDKCSSLVPFGSSCVTSFPAAMLLTGAFNRSLWRLHGQVVGDEMRAVSNFATTVTSGDSGGQSSLAGHGPNINQPRDPRNGRNGELSSECPFLSGVFATEYVLGMQFGSADAALAVNSSTRRMLASLKHYNAYSRETDRMGSEGNVSFFDLWDTYLPQYAAPMQKALAAGTMCSYFSMHIEGAPGPLTYVPSCADPYLLTTVVREYWLRPDATHLSDCGAVFNMVKPHPEGNGFVSLNNFSAAAAVAVTAGMDQNSNTISPSHLGAALAAGLATEASVREAAGRVLAQRLRLGHFDPLEDMPASLRLGPADVGTLASRAAADEGVRQGVALLRNAGGLLPLRRGSRVAVVGPTALSETAAIGDIYGPTGAICPDDSNACWPVVGDAITSANVGGMTTVVLGVQMLRNDSSWAAALAAVDGADAVILSLGTDRSVAGEGSDRADIGLPGVQEPFALAVLERAASASPPVPVVLLLVHNLPCSFDALLAPARAGFAPPAAIVDTWAFTSHGDMLARLLFGAANGFGRAALTVYPHAYQDAVDLLDMSMTPRPASATQAASAGRSYRYYDGSAGAPLVRFGEGLSGYSTFGLACSSDAATIPAGGALAIACNVTHAGGLAGDEVLMVFHRPGADVVAAVGDAHPLPLSALRDFARAAVPLGGTASINFSIDANASLCFTNQVGAQVLYPGTHLLDVWNGNANNFTVAIVVQTPGNSPLVLQTPPLPW
jgi:beta-glucosidase-like glycosyl hydrolase